MHAFFRHTTKKQLIAVMVGVALIPALVYGVLQQNVLSSNASGTFHFEAEDTVPAGSSLIGLDPEASGGKYISFPANTFHAGDNQLEDATRSPETEVTFTMHGDHGQYNLPDFLMGLDAIADLHPDFSLALGDMNYEYVGSEQRWCNTIMNHLGVEYPFEILMGNHEDERKQNGYIGNFVQYCPDQLSSVGRYGAEYYFDYPQSNPLVRVIMIGANNSWDYDGDGVVSEWEKFNYTKNNPSDLQHYNWLSDKIDAARAEQIPWVVVGMHKNCLTVGQKGCEIGTDLLNLLVEKRVDLIAQGHDHTYQRSKQLTNSIPSCDSIQAYSYNPNCVSNTGYDGAYLKGAGSVLSIVGNFGGHEFYDVSRGDAEAGYFVTAMGGNGWFNFAQGNSFHQDNSRGFAVVTVTKNTLTSRFVKTSNPASAFEDSYTITTQASPTPTPSPTLVPTISPTPTEVPPNCRYSTAGLPSVTTSITVPQTGAVYVWSRIQSNQLNQDSFLIKVGGYDCPILVGGDNALNPGNWQWINYQDGDPLLPAYFVLAGGFPNQVTIYGKDPGAKLDRVLFLADDCVPTGTGENCVNHETMPTPVPAGICPVSDLAVPFSFSVTGSSWTVPSNQLLTTFSNNQIPLDLVTNQPATSWSRISRLVDNTSYQVVCSSATIKNIKIANETEVHGGVAPSNCVIPFGIGQNSMQLQVETVFRNANPSGGNLVCGSDTFFVNR
ncbi:metallophosphoesterase [Candidatus Woesebacteria bacterium]|nr:metallophosphoesterase [Candidatus Woesebacteria bacterium]